MNMISHPDWVKLCVELNCAPNQNSFCYIPISAYMIACIFTYKHIFSLSVDGRGDWFGFLGFMAYQPL